jgi:hypothetical protein
MTDHDTDERRSGDRRERERRIEERRGAQVAHDDLRGEERLERDGARGAGTEEDAFDEGSGETYADDLSLPTRHQVLEELSLREIETLTGLPSPKEPSPGEEREYRLLAWENIKLDVGASEEWGGVNPDSDPETTPEHQHDRPPGWGDRDR